MGDTSDPGAGGERRPDLDRRAALRARLAAVDADDVAVIGAAMLAVVASLVPVLALPSVESAAYHGLLVPPVVAATQAFGVPGAVRGARRVASCVARVLSAVGAIVAVRGAIESDCVLPGQLAWLALGPLPGVMLAGLLGELVGGLLAREGSSRRRRFAAAGVALACTLAPLGMVAYELVATPAVYVYSLFAGHYPGPLYDASQPVPPTLLAYRLVSFAAGVALLAALEAMARPRGAGRSRALVVAAAGAALFAGLELRADEFAFRTSQRRLDEALPRTRASRRCVIHLAADTPRREAAAFARQCDVHVRGIEAALAVELRHRVHVYVYPDAATKGRLIGARETYVAKPWRAEVHVQRDELPHHVLRHELVHVVMAAFTDGPFHAGGAWGGLGANPALVEGLAVALGDEVREGLDVRQQARALLEAGKLPPLRALDRGGFYASGGYVAYTTTGAFVRFLLERRGPSAVRAMIRDGRFGGSLALESAFLANLRATPIPEGAVTSARVRALDRGVIATRCARAREELSAATRASLGAHDPGAASRTCARLLAIDPRDALARTLAVEARVRARRFPEAETLLRAMRAGEVPAGLRARLHRLLGDLMLAGDGPDPAKLRDPVQRDRARAHYEAARALGGDEDTLRALEVRLHLLDAADADPDRAAELLAFVSERSEESLAEVSVVARLVLRSAEDPLAAYLLARRLVGVRDHEAAARVLPDVSRLPPALFRVRIECARMRAELAVRAWLETGASRTAGEARGAIARYVALGGSVAEAARLGRFVE